MTTGGVEEIVVYLLAIAQAIGVGLVFACASGSRHRSALNISGLVLIAVAVGAGFALGPRAPWVGPIFAIVTSVTGIVATARSLRDDPAMRDESFGWRVVYALSLRPRRADLDRGATDRLPRRE